MEKKTYFIENKMDIANTHAETCPIANLKIYWKYYFTLWKIF